MQKEEIMSLTFSKLATLLAVASALAGCVSPTTYRVAGAEGNSFGYANTKLSDQLYRISFVGSRRTPTRWVDAFVLYRSAQVAKEAGAPAFRVVEGSVDATVLSGDDTYGQAYSDADVKVSATRAVSQARASSQPFDGDRVVRANDPYQLRTAGVMPVFRAPAPMIKGQAPALIYIPGSGASPFPERSLLVEMRPDLKHMDEQTFVTDDVLGRLGPRIKRAPQSPNAAGAASSTGST